MDPKESVPLLLRMIRVGGVVEESPSLAAAWEVFKRYAEIPVPCEAERLQFEVEDYNSESESEAYIEFARIFEMKDAFQHDYAWTEQVHLEFKTRRGQELGLGRIALCSSDFANAEVFFQAVESLHAFQAGLDYHEFTLTIDHTRV